MSIVIVASDMVRTAHQSDGRNLSNLIHARSQPVSTSLRVGSRTKALLTQNDGCDGGARSRFQHGKEQAARQAVVPLKRTILPQYAGECSKQNLQVQPQTAVFDIGDIEAQADVEFCRTTADDLP